MGVEYAIDPSGSTVNNTDLYRLFQVAILLGFAVKKSYSVVMVEQVTLWICRHCGERHIIWPRHVGTRGRCRDCGEVATLTDDVNDDQLARVSAGKHQQRKEKPRPV